MRNFDDGLDASETGRGGNLSGRDMFSLWVCTWKSWAVWAKTSTKSKDCISSKPDALLSLLSLILLSNAFPATYTLGAWKPGAVTICRTYENLLRGPGTPLCIVKEQSMEGWWNHFSFYSQVVCSLPFTCLNVDFMFVWREGKKCATGDVFLGEHPELLGAGPKGGERKSILGFAKCHSSLANQVLVQKVVKRSIIVNFNPFSCTRWNNSFLECFFRPPSLFVCPLLMGSTYTACNAFLRDVAVWDF